MGTEFDFGTKIDVDSRTGAFLASYFRVRRGKAAETRELIDGTAFADYNRHGVLLGVEILGPCQVKVLDRIMKSEPSPVRSFVKNNMPRKLFVAA